MRKQKNPRATSHYYPQYYPHDNMTTKAVKEEKMTKSKENEIDICKVCMENYTGNCRPRSLNCGHSFCGDCINQLSKSGKLHCPTCKRVQSAESCLCFPINYDLEEMISKFKETQLNNSAQQTSPREMSKKLQCFLEDQADNAESLLGYSDQVFSLSKQYRELLSQRCIRHRELQPMIYELARKNEDIITSLEMEEAKVEEIIAKGELVKEDLSINISLLRSDLNMNALDDVDKGTVDMEGWIRTCQQTLSQATTINDARKIFSATRAALELFNNEANKEEEEKPNPFNCDHLNSCQRDIIQGCNNLTLKRLHQPSNAMKMLLEEDRVFAIQEHKGNARCARVSLCENTLYLHHLRDQEPPLSSYVIRQKTLIETLASDSVTVFLDLAWNGSTQGRVHILLEPASTPFARQFRFLCTGQKGPSYAHCNLLHVVCKGDTVNEAVRTGDYEYNDGSGGASVVTGLKPNEDQYKRALVPGLVWATYNDNEGPQSSQFTITTGNRSDKNFMYQKVFGVVSDGLEVVRKAVQVDNITEVKIIDCGVVLQNLR